MSIDAAEALNLDLHKTLGASRNNPVIKVLVRLYIFSARIVAMDASISKTRLLVLHSRSRRVIKGLHQGIDLRSTQHVEASFQGLDKFKLPCTSAFPVVFAADAIQCQAGARVSDGCVHN